MLDAFIIEELKRRRSEAQRRRHRRPMLEIPVQEEPREEMDHDDVHQRERDRGVIIIDYGA